MRNCMRHILALSGCLLLLATVASAAPDLRMAPDGLAAALGAISGPRMMEDVARLSSPAFNGRQTGTADDVRSARFIVERFESLGLFPCGGRPLPGNARGPLWAQSEAFTGSSIQAPAIMEWTTPAVTTPARLGPDFLPILDSPSAGASAPLIFVGYGISDPAHEFDEYAGLDVRDRVVLFLRGKPEGYSTPVTHADKERTARKRGAIAFLTATGPITSAYETRRGIGRAPTALYSQASDNRLLPGAWISTELAEQLLAVDGQSLREVQERLNQQRKPQSAPTNVILHLAWDSRQESGTLVNVLGMIPGQDPALRERALVIGAHRDHFGRQAGLLFPGADDNASGTAVLLEVAKTFAKSGLAHKRTIVFVSFSGEEQGLFGSRLYVGKPPLPLNQTVAMLNVDHAGIGNGRLTVGLTGLSKEEATEAGKVAGVAELLDLYGFFPGGDHVPFKEAGTPTATIVSAGPHPHFHQPSDTADTVKTEILERAARYLFVLAWQLANTP
ncbi:MAG: M20/M25/M40 family metallo-hydrolase [Nitrospirae bacterium]|nr:MAG: M20/M25/M40 family metallo-hydrolase [Nitrospirota bacterium]